MQPIPWQAGGGKTEESLARCVVCVTCAKRLEGLCEAEAQRFCGVCVAIGGCPSGGQTGVGWLLCMCIRRQ